MKASDMLTKVDGLHYNEVPTANKVTWLSDVEESVYTHIIEEPYSSTINTVANQQEYALTGFIVEDILQLKVNGTEYELWDAMLDPKANTYYKLNGKLALYPVPTESTVGGITILRRWTPDTITEATAASRDLMLPDAFLDAYEFYLRSRIALEQKDAALADAFASLYTEMIGELRSYYARHRPNTGAEKINKRWKR